MKYRTVNHTLLYQQLFAAVLLCSLIIGIVNSLYIPYASANTKQLHVATYNLRSQRWDGENPKYGSWAARKDRVQRIIKKQMPTIIGMQEVIAYNPDTGKRSPQRSDVNKFMKAMNYDVYAGSRTNSSPLYWKADEFKLLQTKEIKIFKYIGERAPRYITYAHLKHLRSGKQIIVMNYHFNQFEAQSSQLSKLSSKIGAIKKKHPKINMFITGDFNGYHNRIVSSLKGSGVRMRVADKHTGIDHVLVSPRANVKGSKVVGPGNPAATDHPLVISRLLI